MLAWKSAEVLPCGWKADGDAKKCVASGHVVTLLRLEISSECLTAHRIAFLSDGSSHRCVMLRPA